MSALSHLVSAQESCKNFYRTSFELTPGEIVLVGERHGDTSLKYIYSRYEVLLKEDKIFLGVEGEFISDRQFSRFGLESEFAYNLSLLASAKGFLQLRSQKSLPYAIQRIDTVNKTLGRISNRFLTRSALNLLHYESVVSQVAILFNEYALKLENPENSWLLEIDPQLPSKISILEQRTRQLLGSSNQLVRENQDKDFEADPLEVEIIVNLRNKIFYRQLEKYSELAKTTGKPIFVIVGNEHVFGLNKMLSDNPQIKARSLTLDQDYSTITHLLIDVQFPKPKLELKEATKPSVEAELYSGLLKRIRMKLIKYF